jgi:hypothetical protein
MIKDKSRTFATLLALEPDSNVKSSHRFRPNIITSINNILFTAIKRLDREYVLVNVSISLSSYNDMYKSYLHNSLEDLVSQIELSFEIGLFKVKSKELYRYQTQVKTITLGDMLSQCEGGVGTDIYTGMRRKLLSSSMLSCLKHKLIKLLSPQLHISTEGLSISNRGLVVNSMLAKDQSPRNNKNNRQIKSKTGAVFPLKFMARFVTKIKPKMVSRVKKDQGRHI